SVKIEKLKEATHTAGIHKKPKPKFDSNKPTIVILHAGGTIASRVDYRTGAVTPLFTADDMLEMFPEIAGYANIRTHIAFQMFSEDMEPEHWQILARKVAEEVGEGCNGIIITHGTDTMHYTSAALALMLQNLPIPVLLVGAQRSSDRGSSDAAMNLICAANFIANSDFAGVAICMHSSPNDDFCNILPACKTRKIHTSRRDAFQAINDRPIAKVNFATGKIEFMKEYAKKNASKIVKLEDRFDKKIAIVKLFPGFRAEYLAAYDNCHGIILEGTGLGHAATNVLDDFTQHHSELLKKLEQMSKKGIFIAMTSQCIFGRVNLDVYSTGRDLQKAGISPAYMLSEAAYVKLGWVLGHTRDPHDIRKMMNTDYAGEIIERIEPADFVDERFKE
ncbi:MAG: Glu-tRNA(Gln) amidotransferase subunit GatD, partial [Candidatus Aenigmarchaeota archaeon]|nr:Glu-tRNA(Gln) amidotransferase subunit GatD [Candidatus Aenigmarchaeota archaeon]